ncbi:hypothetical protein LMG28138_01291 [Pararobbsia alpina]|uniref:Uncharacterized protein n=1 Tax=Pararobbsia alpina TaxID=621374 RepID=A0A6S7B7A1_9BURK|nr:hypothetical protein LMG28138_01291 [Pararobbsia alpina]
MRRVAGTLLGAAGPCAAQMALDTTSSVGVPLVKRVRSVSADPNNNNLITPAKLPTGTGIWNFSAGVSVLKTYDPVVLFGSLSYTYNVATSFADISSVQGQVEPGKVKLGDIFQIGAGAAIALSDKTSASLSFTTAIEPETKTDTGSGYVSVPGSQTNASTMNFGLSSTSI